MAGFDGYIFVTAEYNRGLPAVLKNALDRATEDDIDRTADGADPHWRTYPRR